MRIGIDARYLSHGLVGGVHAYVAYLIPALLEARPDLDLYLYADTKSPFELTDLPENVTVRYLPYRNELSSIYNDLLRVRDAMEADGIEVAHFPANYGFGPRAGRTVITLHDQVNLLPLRDIIRGHRKDVRSVTMMSYLHWVSTRAIHQADLIITVSQYSRENILKQADYDPQRVVVWTHGPSPAIRKITDEAVLQEVRQRHQLEKPFVIADAVKNPSTLVDAWKLLPDDLRNQYQIVFFSRTPNPLPCVWESVEAGHSRLLIRPSDEDVRALYSMARALAFPSWYEGLGLPLLEAMLSGAPVVASDRGAIPEVVGDAALLCDAEDRSTFARHLAQVLRSPEEHQRLTEAGYKRAAQFTWDKTAQAYLEFYEQAYRMQPFRAVRADHPA